MRSDIKIFKTNSNIFGLFNFLENIKTYVLFPHHESQSTLPSLANMERNRSQLLSLLPLSFFSGVLVHPLRTFSKNAQRYFLVKYPSNFPEKISLFSFSLIIAWKRWERIKHKCKKHKCFFRMKILLFSVLFGKKIVATADAQIEIGRGRWEEGGGGRERLRAPYEANSALQLNYQIKKLSQYKET